MLSGEPRVTDRFDIAVLVLEVSQSILQQLCPECSSHGIQTHVLRQMLMMFIRKKDSVFEQLTESFIFGLQEYYKLRLQTLQQLKDSGENPYPHKFHVSISLANFIEQYGHLKDGDVLEEVTVSLAGRIHAIRESGAKLRFYDCRGEGVKLQIMANAKYFRNEQQFEDAVDKVRRGDVVGFVGHPAKTKKVTTKVFSVQPLISS